MNKNQILEKLKLTNSALLMYGVNEAGLFGSYVRNENKNDSDIDILIDFENGKETFDNFMKAYDFLEKLFEGYKVQVVTKKGLSPFIGPHILKEVQYAKVA
ncbi:MAG: nucleotidyltransferase family protein [Bacteroidia bacterium]